MFTVESCATMSLLVDEYERLLVRIFLGLCLLVMASLLVMCNA